MVGNATSATLPPNTGPVAVNDQTGAVQAATIGYTASPVAVGIIVSMVLKVGAIAFPALGLVSDADIQTMVQLGFLGFSLAADGFALAKRVYSKLQPITLGGGSAKVIPAILLAFLLVGCNATTAGNRERTILLPTTPTVVASEPVIVKTKLDLKIANYSEAVGEYCAHLKAALVLGDLSVQGGEAVFAQVQAGVNAFCVQPPKDLRQALLTLADIYLAVMEARGQTETLNTKYASLITTARRRR
jgi:hypothetical protein